MTAKVLESQLVISAKDRTGAVFDEVGRRFDRLAAAGKRFDSVGRDFLNVASSVDQVGRKLETVERKLGRIETLGKRLGNAFGAVGAAAAAWEAQRFTRSLAERTARAATEGQHERVRMEAAGMAPSEIGEAEATAARLSAQFTPLSQTTVLHALRNARSIVGTYQEAAEVLEPMLRLRVIAQGAHPERSEELEGDFDALIKGMEIKGVTQDMPKFTHYLDNMAKALNVFGDTLRPTDYYEMFKYGRAATQGLSDKFMLMTAPTFAQEMGGSSAGKAFSTFFANIIGGRMRTQSANELDRLGLIDRSKVKISKAGLITQMSPGAVQGSALAAADPYRWVNEVFLPALAKHGITDKAKIQAEIGSVFRDQTAAQLVTILATQQSRIEKDWNLIEHAAGLDAADTFMNKDVAMNMHAVGEQLNNLLQAAGGPMAPAAAMGLHAIADGLAYLADKAREHPTEAGTGLIGALGAGGLAVWEASAAALGKFGMIPESWASAAMRAPLTMLPAGIVGLGSAYLGKKATEAVYENPKYFSGLGEGGMLGALSPEGYVEAASLANNNPPEAKLTGEAKITIDVNAPEGTSVSSTSNIPGVKIGTTGNVGKAWDDIVVPAL